MEGEKKVIMHKYIIKRILLAIPTFIGITIITYSLVRFAPGDYSTIKAGLSGGLKTSAASKEIIEQEKKLYGLDKNPILGYLEWFGKFMRLDLGKSRVDDKDVSTLIAERLPITLFLNIITILLTYIISIPIGIVSAVRKDSLFDRGSSLILFILYSLPSFWVGLLLLKYLSNAEFLNIFPLGGINSDWLTNPTFFQWLADRTWHLILPIVTLTYGSFAFLSRYARANMLEVINQQYITTAKAKGLSNFKVVFVHAFRNSLIPLVTLMATLLPALLGGSVIVEKIFTIPGLGKLAFDAIYTRNIPVIMAVTSISALLTLGGILIADIMYSIVDPRIRLESDS